MITTETVIVPASEYRALKNTATSYLRFAAHLAYTQDNTIGEYRIVEVAKECGLTDLVNELSNPFTNDVNR